MANMKSEFKTNILNKNEIQYLQEWTDDSFRIKSDMWDEKETEATKTLFSLFDKYSSNVKSGTKLYRGMNIPNSLFYGMGYHQLEKGDNYTPDTLAISSFSLSKLISFEYAMDGEYKNNVIIRVLSSDENAINITGVSTVSKEEETILTKNVWYNIAHIKRFEEGGNTWTLIMLIKK